MWPNPQETFNLCLSTDNDYTNNAPDNSSKDPNYGADTNL